MLEKKSQKLNFNKEYPKYSHKEKYLTHTHHMIQSQREHAASGASRCIIIMYYVVIHF